MVYAGNKGKQRFTLGVSGRLKERNLVMWDEETGSLWSQILGKGLHGKSKGVELDMIPALFVGMGTWKRMHPTTKVLNLSLVRQRSWFYTSEDLARGKVRGRGGPLTLAVGLRKAGDTLAVPLPLLHEKGVVNVEVGGMPLAVVWHAEESAALVYDRRAKGKTVGLELDGKNLQERGGKQKWDALTGTPEFRNGVFLARFPYVPTYVKAWKSYYKKGRVLDR